MSLLLGRCAAFVSVTALAAVATACGSTSTPSGAAATTTAPHATTTPPTTTAPPLTPTTVAPPSSPQPSADGAASALVSAWSSGNSAAAHTVATPQAVATLFAVPYPQGLAIDRGCTSAFPPLICTFGPPANGPPNAAIYQIYVSQAPGGWYVSSVTIES